MTNEEAIELLKYCESEQYCSQFTRRLVCDRCNKRIALDMAIEALSANTVSREFYEEAIKANHGLAQELCELKASAEPKTIANNCDLISRADAIKAIECCEIRDINDYRNFLLIDKNDAKDAIESVPSADRPTDDDVKDRQIKQLAHDVVILERQLADRPSGEWKLASEELPQSVGSYIVTCKDEQGWVYVDYDFWTVADKFKYNYSKVTAWMPFPKPYCGARMNEKRRME